MRKLIFLVLVLFLSAHAAPPAQPLPRDGSCPGGYYSSGNYCVSMR